MIWRKTILNRKEQQKQNKGPETEMRLIGARSRRRPRWHKVVKFKTVVGDHIREAGRAIMSGDERKKKAGGIVGGRGRWYVLPRSQIL